MFDYFYGAFAGVALSLLCLPPSFVIIALLPPRFQDFKFLLPAIYAALLVIVAAIATVFFLRHHQRHIFAAMCCVFALALLLDLFAGISGLAWYHPYTQHAIP